MSQYNVIEETRFMFSLIFICAKRMSVGKGRVRGSQEV